MLFPIENRNDLEKLEELALLQNQVFKVGLQDNLGEQNYHQKTNKLLEALTDTIKNTSENITKTITETFIRNNKAISDLNEKGLKFLNNKGVIAPYLASSLVNLLKLENKTQFKLIKDFNSTRTNNF